MLRLALFAAAAALAFGPDVSGVLHLEPPQQNQTAVPQDQSVPVLPSFGAPDGAPGPQSASPQQSNAPGVDAAPSQSAGQQPDGVKPADPAQNAASMQEESRMQILRTVDGEFARLLTSLPGGRKGFHIRAGEPIDQNQLNQAIRAAGAALNSGDNVQITRLEFLGKEIQIDLNGGGKKQGSWKDHVQMQVGMPVPVQTRTTTTPANGSVIPPTKTGATLFLDFDRTLPDMSPDQVKQYLSAVLDFSKQRSAAVQWTETLPPEIQKAIAEKRPAVGMDRDEVLAAIGRPDRKVRERQADGQETEDWIYGRPPARTIFVRFIGDKVAQIDSYPD